MNLKITNSENEELILKDLTNGKGWHLSEPALRKRVGVQQRYGRPGGYVTGDREVSSRSLTLRQTLTAQENDTYLESMDRIVNIFDPLKAPFFLTNTDTGRRTEVELQGVTPTSSDGLEMRVTAVAIELIMVESYWEDETSQVVESESGGTASGDILECENEGSGYAWPIITVEALASNSLFTLFNETTQDLITVSTSLFSVGDIIAIDCQNGTIILESNGRTTDISSAIADGTGFLYLQPGENEIKYESAFGAVNISIEWRSRYAF